MFFKNRYIPKKLSLLLLGFFLSLVVTTYNPKINLYIYWGYKYCVLEAFNKKLITQKVISENKVYFYSERIDGKIVELSKFNEFEPIIKKAYEDFPIFINNRYGIVLPEIKNKSLVLTFVGEKTYNTYDATKENGPSGAFTLDDYIVFGGNRIFFKCSNFKFNVVSRKSIIRHEIFHGLENKYDVAFLPHQAAFDFESWVKN